MTTITTVVAIAAAALLSGSAFAASLQPAAGQAPFFADADAVTSTLQRQSVQADAARQMPAAGEMNARVDPAPASHLTRAQVRATVRQAIAQGFHVGVGEHS